MKVMHGSGAETAAVGQGALCRIASATLGVASAVIVRKAEPLPPAVATLWRRAEAAHGALIVEDVLKDEMLAGLSFGPEDGAPRFCAAVPIHAGADTQAAALLLLLDPAPRVLSAQQRRWLADLVMLAQAQFALETAAREATTEAESYRLLAENSADTLVRGSLDGIRLYISPAVRTLLGYEPEELVGKRAMELVHPDDRPAFQALMRQIREGTVENASSEQRQRHKNGAWVWIEAFIRLTHDKITGAPDGYVVSVRDISQRKAAEARLAHLAAHDALTGLANRSLLQQRLEEELARARRAEAGFAVLCLDLDRFKQVNDTYGHAAGDAVLCAAAVRIRRETRREDLVARLGGDEFVVVLGACAAPLDGAERLARRLIEAMAEPVSFGTGTASVGVSIGIAVASPAMVERGAGAGELLRAGDRALYAAKRRGRNRVVVAPSGGHDANAGPLPAHQGDASAR
ncbi:diguanylate cyclase [Xanthobacter sp. V2C-8]|uniref:diguanylate cyclase domain-containing protein n=1 Tax=Xanthobacter albus TaxID=3119929 RepID=UPI003726D3E7